MATTSTVQVWPRNNTRILVPAWDQDGGKMSKSLNCIKCERQIENIAQLEKKTETLHQIHDNEQFTDSVAATVQGAFIHRITLAGTPLGDTLPWMCPNATESTVEAPK